MIVSKAPLRISLGGGGTDLPFFSKLFGGSLTSVAINQYIYITIAKRKFYDDFLIKYSDTERVKSVEDIKHLGIKAALKYLNITDPIEITSVADVPAGMGLGSSGSFLVALLKALHAYKGEEISAFKLAEEAAEIEMKILKAPSGKQDQYLASFGGLINLDINKKSRVLVSPLSISNSNSQILEENLLLFSTGIKHSSTNILSEQKASLESDKERMDQMQLIKKLGEDIKKSLEEGNIQKVGKWLNVHWEIKRKLSQSMSNSKIDSIYKIGIENGAMGGKLVGAGGGGFFLFYCENKKEELRKAMSKEGLKELKFKFDQEGCKIICK